MQDPRSLPYAYTQNTYGHASRHENYLKTYMHHLARSESGMQSSLRRRMDTSPLDIIPDSNSCITNLGAAAMLFLKSRRNIVVDSGGIDVSRVLVGDKGTPQPRLSSPSRGRRGNGSWRRGGDGVVAVALLIGTDLVDFGDGVVLCRGR